MIVTPLATVIFVVLRLATSCVLIWVSPWWSRQWDFPCLLDGTRRDYKVLYAERWIRKKRQEAENLTAARGNRLQDIVGRTVAGPFSRSELPKSDNAHEYWTHDPLGIFILRGGTTQRETVATPRAFSRAILRALSKHFVTPYFGVSVFIKYQNCP